MYELSESWDYNGLLLMERLLHSLHDDIANMNFGCNTNLLKHRVKDY